MQICLRLPFFFCSEIWYVYFEKIIKCKRLWMQRIQQNFIWSFLLYVAGLYISIENLYYSQVQSWNETTFPNIQIFFFIILVTKSHDKKTTYVDSSPLTPGTFDDGNPDARILTPDPPTWSLTPLISDAPTFDSSWTLTPAFWRPYGLWLPYNANVAFDAPIPPGGIWHPNTPGWHLTPQYPRVAFDAPIPPSGIWRPNNLNWHLTPGTIFQIFFFKISWFPFQVSLFRLGLIWSSTKSSKPSLDPRTLVSLHCSTRAVQKSI